jgi:hypothetical protein
LLHVDSVLLRTKKCGENFPHISPTTEHPIPASFSYRIIVGGRETVKETRPPLVVQFQGAVAGDRFQTPISDLSVV